MQLHEIRFDEATPIQGYGPGFFRVAGEVMEGAIRVTATGVRRWGGFDDGETLLALADEIDVLFIGTGPETTHIPADLRSALEDAGMGRGMHGLSCGLSQLQRAVVRRTARRPRRAAGLSGVALLHDTSVSLGAENLCRAGRPADPAGCKLSPRRAGEALVLRGPNGIGQDDASAHAGRVAARHRRPDRAWPKRCSIAYGGHLDGMKVDAERGREPGLLGTVSDGGDGIGPPCSGLRPDRVSNGSGRRRTCRRGRSRRLGLARMMVTGRPIWALDEPTVSLDTSLGLCSPARSRRIWPRAARRSLATHIDLGLDRGGRLDVTPFRALPACRRRTISTRPSL